MSTYVSRKCDCGHLESDHRRNGACVALVSRANGVMVLTTICSCNDFNDAVPLGERADQ